MNKICDAADWSDSDIDRIIAAEFGETPRYHRKQWEFAVLYRELERAGLINEGSRGISFGSATEVMIYALARRVGNVWATDLYGADSAWDIARTDDATQLVRSKAPFTYPPERLAARAMDMREITFPDSSVDFAYSSCAIEHVGRRDDFIHHLREVARVLKPGGVYAFTTEFVFAEETVESPGNFLFSRHMLEDIVRESGLACDAEFDCTLARHHANTPLPSELYSGVADGEGPLASRLFGLMAALHLTCANVAFTSCLVVLRKTGASPFGGWHFRNWEQTRGFIQAGVQTIQGILEEAEICMPPYAWLPHRKSQYFIGHEHFFKGGREGSVAGTLFHTGYFWLGGRRRLLRVALITRSGGDYRLRLKIHRTRGSTPWKAELHSYVDLACGGTSAFAELSLDADAGCSYAVLAEVIAGDVRLVDASITCAPAGAAPLLS